MTWYNLLMLVFLAAGVGWACWALYGKKSGPTHCIGCGKCVADGKCVLYGTPVRALGRKPEEKEQDVS